jgi:protein-S-isoprenylcysteine O-methyltransferase Ste14
MTSDTLLTVLLLAGTAWFLYVYHVRTRHIDVESRQQVSDVPHYEWVDWYLKISSLLITLLSIHLSKPWLIQVHDATPVRWLGMLLAGGALLLFTWAMGTLDTQYSPAHRARLPDRIVSTGPYRWIRHPIYTSNLILLFGLALTSGSLWLVMNLAILVGYYVPTIGREEAAIADGHQEYREYMSRTGRFFPKL